MMKVAFSTWKNRISPVFDVSGEILLVDIDSGLKISEEYRTLPAGSEDRCLWLAAAGVDALVCGAITNYLQSRLEWMNIRVFPFVAGSISQVVSAWMANSLKVNSFAMPGCCRRFGKSCAEAEKELNMKGRKQQKISQGRKGRGQRFRS